MQSKIGDEMVLDGKRYVVVDRFPQMALRMVPVQVRRNGEWETEMRDETFLDRR